MKRVLTIFSTTIIILFFLSLFGWMVSHLVKGDKTYGFLNEPIKFLYSFPDSFQESVKEVKSLPKTFLKTPINFKSINHLTEDLYTLTTYSDTNKTRTIAIINLKDDSIHFKRTVENKYFDETARIFNPVLMPDSSIIFAFESNTGGVIRLAPDGNRMWQQKDIIPHHSMNLDSENNLWICSTPPVYYATGHYKLAGRSVFYKDHYITKINTENGEILFHKSFSEILVENGLEYYITKSANPTDPIHLNDVQPALKTTRYYNEGDVFISSRNLSIIVQYRPSTNELIRVIQGPFSSQHDVDFYNDSSLVFFNNNFYNIWSYKTMKPPKDSIYLTDVGNMSSVITKYDLWDNEFSEIGEEVFEKNNIFSGTEGLVDFINDSTYFVEEQNSGILWVLQGNKVLYKNVFKSQYEGYHHLPNWNRILKQ